MNKSPWRSVVGYFAPQIRRKFAWNVISLVLELDLGAVTSVFRCSDLEQIPKAFSDDFVQKLLLLLCHLVSRRFYTKRQFIVHAYVGPWPARRIWPNQSYSCLFCIVYVCVCACAHAYVCVCVMH